MRTANAINVRTTVLNFMNTPIIHAGISLVDETPEKQSSDQTNPPGSQGLAEGLEFAYTVPTQNTSKKDEVSRFV